MSGVDFPPSKKEKKKKEKNVWPFCMACLEFCKSYVLVKYFLLFDFAFVQFILLCLFHFPNVTIVFKN